MDDFARLDIDERRTIIEQCAAQRNTTATIIEKDFWVCWSLRRLMEHPDLAPHLTFKGGTSLSKSYGVIERFSEDIDLTIAREAPYVRDGASPMEDGISKKEVARRIKALQANAQAFVHDHLALRLDNAFEEALGGAVSWRLEADPGDPDRQTLLFVYPPTSRYGFNNGDDYGGRPEAAYIKPHIKLEFGARGDPKPSEDLSITPYIAEEFPDLLDPPNTLVPTLTIERTFWEKATILHALAHNGRLRPGMSRHYYDTLMLAQAGIGERAAADPALLASVLKNKRLMFADNKASYETADLVGLTLIPRDEDKPALQKDYAEMEVMFANAYPSFDELIKGLADLQEHLRSLAPGGDAALDHQGA